MTFHCDIAWHTYDLLCAVNIYDWTIYRSIHPLMEDAMLLKDGMKHEGCIKSIMDYVAKKIGKLMGKCWLENAGSSQSATVFFICSWINFKCSSTAIAARGSEWCLSGVSSSLRWSAAWIGAITGRRHHSWPPWTASPESLRRHTTNQWRWRRKRHQEWPNRLSLLSYLPLAKQGSSRKSLRESATWWQVSSWSREAAHQLWNSRWPSDAVLVRGWTPRKWSCCCPPWLPKITELVRTDCHWQLRFSEQELRKT